MMKTIEERFREKYIVDKSGDCWEWTASKTKNGYGWFRIGSKMRLAHRVAWFLTHGYYPEKPMQVNHICNNRGCVNPEHLYEGTPKQNTHDSIIAGTKVNHFKKGHKLSAKLTRKEVDKIREESTGEWGEQTRLAKKYGVGTTTIWEILNHERW